jgi:hypothetical protein
MSRQISVTRRIRLAVVEQLNNKMLLIVLPTQTVLFDHPVDVDWGLVVKLALSGKATRRSYKVFGIYDRFLTKVQFNHRF